jgi:hypothetical protein
LAPEGRKKAACGETLGLAAKHPGRRADLSDLIIFTRVKFTPLA